MRRAHVKLVHDPYFDEFIYDIIYSLTSEQKQALDERYVKACSTPKRAKAFCRLASLEQKFHFLASIGIKWATVLYGEKITPKKFKEVLLNYQKERPAAGLKEMAAQKMYVATDREFMFSLMLMSQSIHHPQYSLSVQWNKLGYKLDKWGAWTKTADNVDFVTANENIEAVNKFSLLLEHHKRAMEVSEDIFKIKEVDFRVLNYLFRNRHRHVAKDEIINYFEGSLGKITVYHSIKALFGALYVQQSAMNKKEYVITALGINLIDKFYQRIINSNNL